MIEVYAAVIVREKKIFVAKRNKNTSQGGFWEFPGGKLEKGESPAECLKRELYEELGVDAKVGDYICSSKYRYPEKTICLNAYFVSIKGQPILKEHEAFDWLDYDRLIACDLAPADRPIAKAVKAILASKNRGGNNF